jgi:hypothetical protein
VSGHTPGPWRTDNLVGGYVHAKPTAAHAAKYPKNKWVQVSHVCTFAECSREESEANLRLIAAAPDLLAALKDAREWLREYGVGSANLFGQINSAITKATGEPWGSAK